MDKESLGFAELSKDVCPELKSVSPHVAVIEGRLWRGF